MIRKSGFSGERHDIWTEDGYGLSLYRIPPIKKRIEISNFSVTNVLLTHGTFSCGAQWVVNGNKSLAFMLSIAGYDVWILNSRGTFLSNRHKTLSYDDPQYWDFTFHDMALYDFPAAIDFILTSTNTKKLHYVGYSQGTVELLAGISMRPDYNQKIISAYLFNPAPFLHHMTYPLRDIFHGVAAVANKIGIYRLLLKNSLLMYALKVLCLKKPLISTICHDVTMEIVGGNNHQTKNTVRCYEICKIICNVTSKFIFSKFLWTYLRLTSLTMSLLKKFNMLCKRLIVDAFKCMTMVRKRISRSIME